MIFLQLFVASDHLHRSGIALSGVQGSGAGDPLAKRPRAQQRTKSSKADPLSRAPGMEQGTILSFVFAQCALSNRQ